MIDSGSRTGHGKVAITMDTLMEVVVAVIRLCIRH